MKILQVELPADISDAALLRVKDQMEDVKQEFAKQSGQPLTVVYVPSGTWMRSVTLSDIGEL